MTQLTPQVLSYPGQCAPAGFQNRLKAVAQYIKLPLPDGFEAVLVGPDTPGPSLTGHLWLQTDGNNRPLGMFWYYKGDWRPVYTGKPGQIKMYVGNPSNDFDSTGLGIIGNTWDGWALCNGNNGTIDFRESFVVSAGGYDPVSGYAWLADFTDPKGANGSYPNRGSSAAGAAQVTITANNLPPLIVKTPGFQGIDVGNDGHTDTYSVNTYVGTGPGNQQIILPVYATDGSGPTGSNTAINTIPPYNVVGFVQFLGYT